MPPHTKFARWIDPPRKLDPKLVFLPYFAGVCFVGEVDVLASALSKNTLNGLPKGDPLRGMGFLTHYVVPFCAQPHRQHIIGEPRGFTPYRSQRSVKLDLRFVSENLDPAHPIGISPYRVVDSSEICGEMTAAVFEKMRKQEAHLVMR